MNDVKYTEIKELLGKTPVKVETLELCKGKWGELLFTLSDGTQVKFHHEQECCEQVDIESIDGDLDDLVGVPLTVAEEATKQGENEGTWTFYRFAGKGHVTVRWYGTSGSCYSEKVSILVTNPGS